MAPEGRICPVGFAGGTIQQVPANLLLVKNLTVCGVNMGYYAGWSPNDVRYEHEDRIRAMMTQLFDWYEAGLIKTCLRRSISPGPLPGRHGRRAGPEVSGPGGRGDGG